MKLLLENEIITIIESYFRFIFRLLLSFFFTGLMKKELKLREKGEMLTYNIVVNMNMYF